MSKSYEARKEKCEAFKKSEFDKAEKQWNSWILSSGGISQNLGKFIKSIKRDPSQRIILKRKDGSLAIDKPDVLAEMKRAWDLVYFYRFWDNNTTANLVVTNPVLFNLNLPSFDYFSEPISTNEVIKALEFGTSVGASEIPLEAIRYLSSYNIPRLKVTFQEWLDKKVFEN